MAREDVEGRAMVTARATLRGRTAVAVTATSVLLAGCSVLPGGQDDPAPSATPSPASDDVGTVTGAGAPRTEDELRRTLPAPADLGDGWGDDPGRTVGELQTTQVSPGSCAPLITKGDAWDGIRASQRARVQANFRHGQSAAGAGRFLAVWAYSTDEPAPVRLFDEAGARIGDCATMDVTQADTGLTSTYRTTQLAFPNLGDRTLALRLVIAQSQQTVTMDFVVVKVGHTTISVANSSSTGEPDTATTERAVRSSLETLKETS